MKKELALVLIGFALAVMLFTIKPTLTGYFTAQSATCQNPILTTVTSPGATGYIVGLIDSARSEIKVEIYVFTSRDVLSALDRAVKRGVKVEVILEPRVSNNFDAIKTLKEYGVLVKWASTSFANTHSKLIIVDGITTFVGSTNLSMHALELNRETAVIINDPCTAAFFVKTFDSDWAIATNVK